MALIFLSLICGAYAHGYMKGPKSRQVVNRKDYNRNSPVGRSATCGRLYDSTGTNEFEIVKTLSPGQSFDVQLLLSANHIGQHWFEYACMDSMLNKPTSDSSVRWNKLSIDSLPGKTETDESGGDSCKSSRFLSGNVCTLKVRAPPATCNHGVLKWVWIAVHGSRQNPEVYKNCADLRIGTGGGSSVQPSTGTRPPIPATSTRRPPRPVRPVTPQKSAKQQRCESNGCMNYCGKMTRSCSTSEDNTSSVVIGVVFGGIALVVLAGALAGYVFAKKRKEGRGVPGPKE
eukprot:GEMP01048019.1.p1 GENE.GEMP01048019.1~~GEMP01048019.1.p1  ORF type:complete len:287 (+),score=20.64 GEMP01048019.1:119-979(+)